MPGAAAVAAGRAIAVGAAAGGTAASTLGEPRGELRVYVAAGNAASPKSALSSRCALSDAILNSRSNINASNSEKIFWYSSEAKRPCSSRTQYATSSKLTQRVAVYFSSDSSKPKPWNWQAGK